VATGVSFHFPAVTFIFKHRALTKEWLVSVAKCERYRCRELRIIFVDDETLYEMNKSFLNHHTYTDIITFDLKETDAKEVVGELYISADRVKENAVKFGVSFRTELDRVMVHGLLHLLGYKDKSKDDQTVMRKLEDKYLKRRTWPI
jgi:probable rRNA maturation factor